MTEDRQTNGKRKELICPLFSVLDSAELVAGCYLIADTIFFADTRNLTPEH